MSQKRPKNAKCTYAECMIPNNNNCYFWQLAFLFFGVFAFLAKSNEFSFFNIFLFLCPVLLDLFYNDVKGPILRWVKRIYIVVDVLCVLLCFLGFTMLQEVGLDVNVEFLYLGSINLSVLKRFMVYVLLGNLAIPIIFYIGRPCKKNMETINSINNMQNRRKTMREEETLC